MRLPTLYLSLAVVWVFGIGGCTRAAPEVAKAKLFAFNPQEYLNVRTILEGRVIHKGPAGVYIILEDDTGKVLVSAHEQIDDFACAMGNSARVSGQLARLNAEGRYYFVMDNLLECETLGEKTLTQ